MRRRRSLFVVGLLMAVAALDLLGATAALAGDPANVGITRETMSDGGTRLIATVTDDTGSPVKSAPGTFYGKTVFGWLVLGEAVTNETGRAEITLSALSPYPEVAAEVAGDSELRAAILLERMRPWEPAVRPGPDALRSLSPQPGFISPYPVPQLLILGVILGGIWTTYAYLVSLLSKIPRAR